MASANSPRKQTISPEGFEQRRNHTNLDMTSNPEPNEPSIVGSGLDSDQREIDQGPDLIICLIEVLKTELSDLSLDSSSTRSNCLVSGIVSLTWTG